jgi:hypothetical protein
MTKGPHACWLVEDEHGEELGYWRDEATARRKAEEHGGRFLELDPPDPIACEDDPEPVRVH